MSENFTEKFAQDFNSTAFRGTRLFELTDKIYTYSLAAGMLDWDLMTGAPKGGNAVRGRVISQLSAEAFGISISDEMRAAIEELEAKGGLDPITGAAVREMRRHYDSQNKIPVEEMREYSELTVAASDIWEDAKNSADFNKFAPTLERIIEFNKRFVGYRGYTGNAYNTLLDDYENGLTTDKLDAFFAKVKATIVPLLKAVSEAAPIDDEFRTRFVSVEKQKKISELLLDKLGFDRNHGQLRESAHPFTTSFSRDDARITTHYYENDVLSSLYSVIHEAGHALYEMGKCDAIAATVLDDGASMAIHESQSRFYENVIGRSEAFWDLIYPEFSEILGSDFADVSKHQWYLAANRAKPTFVRTEADELTYSLHIMVRYEIEKAIFTGGAKVSDLPRLWNEKYNEYLGITPPDDKLGVLQDVHWSGGSFGYFPSYSLGNAYAAQLLSTLSREIDLESTVRSGRISDITTWLRRNIHSFGQIYTPGDLIERVTGEELNADFYVKYLRDKFTAIYNLK